jgi:hypothetical protein
VRHNLSGSEYWPDNGGLASFEDNAELDRTVDGSKVQDIATALTVNQARGDVVRYESIFTVGRPVKTL